MKDVKLESIEQQASYAIGLQIGQQLLGSELKNLDAKAIALGLNDVLTGQPPALALDVLQNAMRQLHEQAAEAREQQVAQMAQAGKEFLQQNLQNEGVKSTESGLQYKVLHQGDGQLPAKTDRVQVHYTGRLIDGTVFDSSVERGEPAEFALTSVIPGWTEALQLMPVGSRWELYIPYQLAYGERGAGAAIPPCSTLIFEVELLNIV